MAAAVRLPAADSRRYWECWFTAFWTMLAGYYFLARGGDHRAFARSALPAELRIRWISAQPRNSRHQFCAAADLPVRAQGLDHVVGAHWKLRFVEKA